jgi:hypothetical protein
MFSFAAFLLMNAPVHLAAGEPVQVVVLVVLASDKGTKVDEKVAAIASEVTKKNPQLTCFRLLDTVNQNVPIGELKAIELVEKATMDLVINEKTNDEGRMTMTVKPPKLDEITYACTCGKFFPIITNYYTANGERLIVAIMAKPCKKKQP